MKKLIFLIPLLLIIASCELAEEKAVLTETLNFETAFSKVETTYGVTIPKEGRPVIEQNFGSAEKYLQHVIPIYEKKVLNYHARYKAALGLEEQAFQALLASKGFQNAMALHMAYLKDRSLFGDMELDFNRHDRSHGSQIRKSSQMPYAVTLDMPYAIVTVPIHSNVYILDGAEEDGILLPYSERAGAGSTCVMKQVSGGFVDQSDQTYLVQDEIDAGFFLPCVAYPVSDMTAYTHQEEELFEFKR